MSEQNSENILGFPSAPALELAGAVEQLRIASHGVIGGDDSLLKNAIGLLPVIEQIQAGETDVAQLGIQDQSTDLITRMEPYTKVLARFDNPRKAFVKDVGRVAGAILADAKTAAERAGKPEFGFGEVTNGIRGVLGDLIELPEEETGALPLLSHIVIARKRRPKPLKLPPKLILMPLVPEILTMLEAPLPKSRQHPELIESLRQNPVVSMAKRFQDRELEAVRRAAPVLLTSVRDLLPTEGSEVTERFEAIKELLQTATY